MLNHWVRNTFLNFVKLPGPLLAPCLICCCLVSFLTFAWPVGLVYFWLYFHLLSCPVWLQICVLYRVLPPCLLQVWGLSFPLLGVMVCWVHIAYFQNKIDIIYHKSQSYLPNQSSGYLSFIISSQIWWIVYRIVKNSLNFKV